MFAKKSKIAVCCSLIALSSHAAKADLYRVDLRYENGRWSTYQDSTLKSSSLNLWWAVQEAHKLLSPDRTPAKKGLVVVNWDSTTPNSYGTAHSDIRDATNVIYEFKGFRVSPSANGACIKATRCHNMEIRNFKAQNTGGWAFLIHFVSSNNITVNNIDLISSSGPFGIRMDGSSRTARMENPRVTGTVSFQGIASGRHGIETMYVKDFSAPTTIKGTQLGGCAVLFNETDGGYIEAMDVNEYGLDSPYAAFRIANTSMGNMRLTYFKANNGNRGLTTLASCTQNLTVDRFEITGTKVYYVDGQAFGGSGEGMRLISGTETKLGRYDRLSFIRGSEGCGLAIYGGAGKVDVQNTEISGSPYGLGIKVENGTTVSFLNCVSKNNGNLSRNYAPNMVSTNSTIDWKVNYATAQ